DVAAPVVLRRVRTHAAVGAIENGSVVEVVAQDLQDSSDFRPALHRLPETLRPAAIDAVVSMVIRPDSVSCNVQNIAPQDPCAQPHQNVRFEGSHALQITGREAVETFASYRSNVQYRHIGQQFSDRPAFLR